MANDRPIAWSLGHYRTMTAVTPHRQVCPGGRTHVALMSSATISGREAGEAAGSSTELVVAHDDDRERSEPGAQPDREVSEGAGAVAFEGQEASMSVKAL
jgi:hypothetical protein